MIAEPTPVLAVFVPGLMGAGILLSCGLLLADGVRRLMPKLGARRRLAVTRAVHALVDQTAKAAGYAIGEREPIVRRPRPRGVYLSVGIGLATVGILAIRTGLATYRDPNATLHLNPWAIALGDVVGIALLILALGSVTLAVFIGRRSRFVQRLVATTLVGRLCPSPEEPRERIHAIPWLKRGDVP